MNQDYDLTDATFDLPTGAAVRATLLAIEPERRLGAVAAYLRRELAEVLAEEPARIDFRRPIRELGLDSIRAIELRTRVEDDLCFTVPRDDFALDLPLGALAERLVRELGEGPALGFVVSTSPPHEPSSTPATDSPAPTATEPERGARDAGGDESEA